MCISCKLPLVFFNVCVSVLLRTCIVADHFVNSSKERTTHTKVPKIDATDGFSGSYNVTYFGIVLMQEAMKITAAG